jgi:hypothetical protein
MGKVRAKQQEAASDAAEVLGCFDITAGGWYVGNFSVFSSSKDEENAEFHEFLLECRGNPKKLAKFLRKHLELAYRPKGGKQVRAKLALGKYLEE